MNTAETQHCRASIAHHSKSFALASRLLPGRTADRAAAVYAWCRRADDAIDLAPSCDRPAALDRLREELSRIRAGEPQTDVALSAFAQVVQRSRIPLEYPEELLAGMAMDCNVVRYANRDELARYCFRVAGTVGLMMCHVMGVGDARALRHAAHLGIAMQLTNICRDVLEDWHRDRLYLPLDLLAECGAPDLDRSLGEPFPDAAREPVARAVRHTLDEADEYYRSGDAGLGYLSWRCALAVRAARRIYAGISRQIRRQECDVTRGRAYTSRGTKLLHVGRATTTSVLEFPGRAWRRSAVSAPQQVVRFPQDVLPV